MKFHSTNYENPHVSFKTAILQGQASDNGLFMPNRIPKIPSKVLSSFRQLRFHEIAFHILSMVIKDSIPEKILKKIIKEALNFEIPLEKINEYDYICYLDRGPTCSFKDFGARVLARMMEYFLNKDNKNITILTATSGDTGGAVAQAFYGMKKIEVIVLYPQNEVSNLQRKQMTTLGENVTAIGINGKFDDCQELVKKAFSDDDLQDLNLSSANSINFGRLFPQTLYYFWSYFQIIEKTDETVIFSIPSGNFGNLTAGLIAKKMGLPIEKFISAVNGNDEFPKFLKTGVYQKLQPSKNCISNAMNVGHPSNLARIVDLYGGKMDQDGKIYENPDFDSLRNEIISYSIDDDLTKNTILNFYQTYNKIIEPHGAVGWGALLKFREEYPNFAKIKSIVFETAHPSKFPSEIRLLIDQDPVLPKTLQLITKKKEFPNPINIKRYSDFKDYLIKRCT